MRRFRFGVNFGGVGIDAWTAFCRTAERSGYDTVLAPDHLGAPSPFAMLAAAAVATDRLRLGTFVVDNEFWNPALLAREAATVDRLSGGRLELGLGAGHMKAEFDAAGLPWRPHAERVDRLEAAVGALDRLFAEGGQEPRPHQAPRPPLLIGAHGERALRVAARHADIVGFGGLTQVKGRPMGTFTLAGSEETLRRVAFVREHADGRDPEFNVLVQAVVLTDDAERTADDLAAAHPEFGLATGRAVLDSPFVLVGTVEEVAAEIVRRRAAYGFSYVSTHGPFADALARVIPVVRRLAGEEAGVS
ncbi:TIGR03621 family F420-dependent LLM class oxidoreductase [Nocardiopsis trehalosi]|jgi:probable F420-dependent oxidoreductase|uniref:TIGR03621 family F420-dependent LLM class oxidoreductase n=1 Tax=Nocardiopsis trehalosi TaxID=109329 RepID=UPI0008352473|nr:TIGR03621 family F420-dependent LLM class oxidoreductase [Nocardiopsis trehalosi]